MQGINHRDALILHGEEAIDTMKVLASVPRMQILELLSAKNLNISEIAEALSMTQPSVSVNVQKLEEVGLIKTDYQPGTQGFQKICSRVFNDIVVRLPRVELMRDEHLVEVAMPIGLYHDIQVSKLSCGLITESEIIGHFDDPTVFHDPKRVYAQLLWFGRGWVEYYFPNNLPPSSQVYCLELSMEICSEAPMYNLDYPAEITLWINGVDIGTWICPGDYGGERGKLTPNWWRLDTTQYGLFKRWTVNESGSWIDGLKISETRIHTLQIRQREPIRIKIGVKDDAVQPGGINLFGEKFGNYPQNINLRLNYNPLTHQNRQERKK
jgi:predicted transcriptional regulator